ncbi:MAG: polyprenyl synthetase family protein [Deinococcales bacterium]
MSHSKDLISRLQERIAERLPKEHPQQELNRFVNYLKDYPERGGKYIRSQLLVLSCLAHGGQLEAALDVGAALELFQNWVLIHDDIEDDSEERRGKPALHRLIGMPLALNVGDALHVYMWRVLHGLPNSQNKPEIIEEFSQMILRTAEGQHLDLNWTQTGQLDIRESDYIEMVRLKTAYYTVLCPLRLGALCADQQFPEELNEAALNLGIAFQIRDDVLNLLPSQGYGKEFAGDLYEAKRTLILAHTFGHASETEKALLIKCLSLPRQEKRPQDIDSILDLIRRYASLDYAQAVADKLAQQSLATFRLALADLNPHAQNILTVMESLATRKA